MVLKFIERTKKVKYITQNGKINVRLNKKSTFELKHCKEKTNGKY